MLIAQLSDVHVGGTRHRPELLRTAIAEVNEAAVDLVVVAGDLTDDGYPDQYELAQEELSALTAEHVVYVPTGFYYGYQAWRSNVTGIVKAPIPFFWGVAKA